MSFHHSFFYLFSYSSLKVLAFSHIFLFFFFSLHIINYLFSNAHVFHPHFLLFSLLFIEPLFFYLISCFFSSHKGTCGSSSPFLFSSNSTRLHSPTSFNDYNNFNRPSSPCNEPLTHYSPFSFFSPIFTLLSWLFMKAVTKCDRCRMLLCVFVF